MAFFLPTHLVLHWDSNLCDTACPVNSPILDPRLPDYFICPKNRNSETRTYEMFVS